MPFSNFIYIAAFLSTSISCQHSKLTETTTSKHFTQDCCSIQLRASSISDKEAIQYKNDAAAAGNKWLMSKFLVHQLHYIYISSLGFALPLYGMSEASLLRFLLLLLLLSIRIAI